MQREAKERQRQAGEEYGRGQDKKVESNLTQAIETDTGRTAEIMAKKAGFRSSNTGDVIRDNCTSKSACPSIRETGKATGVAIHDLTRSPF